MKKCLLVVISCLVLALILPVASCGQKAPNRIAVLETSYGTIKFELYEDKAPITTANFIKLANAGFYNGLIFHRVVNTS